MATEKVGVQIEVDSSLASKSIGQLRKEIVATTEEVEKLQKQYGESSEQAIAAQKKLQQLQEVTNQKIEKQNEFIDNGAKTVTALSAAYGGLQGALELTGLAGEDTIKQLAKIQSALAIADAVQNLAEFRGAITSTFSTLGKTAKTAFNAIKSGIGATGIGLFVIALGLIVTNFDEIKKAVLRLFPGLEKLGSFFIKIAQNVTDFIGVTSEAGRQLDELKKKTDRNAEAIQNRIKVLQAQGGKEQEIYELSKRLADEELNFLKKKAETDKSLTAEESKRYRDLINEKAVLDASEQKRRRDAAEQFAKEERDKVIEREKEARKKLYEEEDKATKSRFVRTEVNAKTRAEIERIYATEGKVQLNNKLIELDDSLAQKSLQTLASDLTAKSNKANKEIELEKAKKDAQVQLATDALNTVAGLIDQNSVAGKAIAVVQAIINTYQGASKAIAQGGIFGPVAAAATIAAGLVQVRKIISTKIPSAKGTGNVADTGGGGMSMAAAPIGPSAPIQNTVTQLDQTSINRLGSATSRAYVVESDITNSQEKITRINRAARLG